MDDISLQIKQAKLAKAQAEAEAATLKLRLIQLGFRPSLNLPVRVYREGGHWVCVLETSEEMTECPVAYGDSPHQACINFDHLWLGLGVVMEHPHVPDDDEEHDDDDDELDEEFDLADEDDDDGEEY